jgi:PTS system mannitol-specific IIC component
MSKGNTKATVQRIGRSLSSMVMPNIGAFVAWGLITALFISTGWWPNEKLATLVSPMLTYLLPLLIAYTAGKNIAGLRGSVIACIASIGVIVGTDIPMFLGVMLFAPLSAWIIKQFDKLIDGKVKAGFEMLVDNFSLGIIGMLLAIVGYYLVGPFVAGITAFLTAGATWIYNAKLLPLISIFVEPAKVLFLNNAINHGIMGPIGIQQAAETGKSIMFLIETNPGPGMGIILAYWLFGKGQAKSTAPGAAIIHFLGGIHEIYFPYVLMNPALLLAVIGGGAVGVLTNVITGAGLVATPSPGSIFALLAMAPKGDTFWVLLSVLTSCAVSFAIGSIFVRRSAKRQPDDGSLAYAQQQVQSMKAESKGKLKPLDVKIVFACDAGMGSSAMGATTLRKQINKAGFDTKVLHSSIEDIPDGVEYVLTQSSLADRARAKAPNAKVFTIDNFMNAQEYDTFIAELLK